MGTQPSRKDMMGPYLLDKSWSFLWIVGPIRSKRSVTTGRGRVLQVAGHSIIHKTSRKTLKTLLNKDQYLNTQ